MYLLTIKTRGKEAQRLFNDRGNAIAEGLKALGIHNPDDGCSTERTVMLDMPKRWRAIRSSSFGQREALIEPIEAPEDWYAG